MKNFYATVTEPNTVKYPLHRHSKWEIMYYLEGVGYLKTEKGNIPFAQGDIIIVPPKIEHGSVSENGFVNISISGDFEHLLMFEEPQKLHDNEIFEGEILARVILQNRYSGDEYVSALCTVYIHFLLKNAEYDNRLNRAVTDIVSQMTERFSDTDFNVTEILNKSGYAEDYIRTEFKVRTGVSPVRFLTNIRIEHAVKLFEIYGQSITVSEAALRCGFNDVVYFSKRFKQIMGESPECYKNRKR